MGMGAQLKRYKALNPGENHARAAAGGRGCTQAGVALHMHTPTHTYPCTCTCTCTCTCHLSWLLAAPIPALLVACCARQQLAHWWRVGPP